jgi:hypothetical protein
MKQAEIVGEKPPSARKRAAAPPCRTGHCTGAIASAIIRQRCSAPMSNRASFSNAEKRARENIRRRSEAEGALTEALATSP